jgi:hypothetical protein
VSRLIGQEVFHSNREERKLDRDRLNFESAVLQNFEYLEREYDFRCTERSAFLVRFESSKVFIDVYHGLKDYEVGIGFGRTGIKKRFGFRLFPQRFFPVEETKLGDCVAGTPEKVQQVTKTLSELFSTAGRNVIEEDDATYKVMETVHWWDFRPDALRHGQ